MHGLSWGGAILILTVTKPATGGSLCPKSNHRAALDTLLEGVPTVPFPQPPHTVQGHVDRAGGTLAVQFSLEVERPQPFLPPVTGKATLCQGRQAVECPVRSVRSSDASFSASFYAVAHTYFTRHSSAVSPVSGSGDLTPPAVKLRAQQSRLLPDPRRGPSTSWMHTQL